MKGRAVKEITHFEDSPPASVVNSLCVDLIVLICILIIIRGSRDLLLRIIILLREAVPREIILFRIVLISIVLFQIILRIILPGIILLRIVFSQIALLRIILLQVISLRRVCRRVVSCGV